MGGKRGFTLIELLIVVAIIAILAAIAVPNFLEAQTRAKVSRVKNDLRSLATAIESYLVDNNITILGSNDWQQVLGLTADVARLYAHAKLTTPIAYLSSFLMDPFYVESSQGTRMGRVYEFRSHNDFSATDYARCRLRGYIWGVNSIGPVTVRRTSDNDPSMQDVLRGIAPGFVYDPTNGTVSKGFIIRTNKGEYTFDNSPPV
jgi:prepilin-type N-terminal cleavage/methylation domain-containing protein